MTLPAEEEEDSSAPANPRRRYSTCHRHPSEPPLTGFCGSCLRERLSYLDSPSHSSAAAADPDLRRCRSYSARKYAAAPAGGSEPRRNSCDVRGRRSLSNLFEVDDDEGVGGSDLRRVDIGIKSKKLGFLEVNSPVLEAGEENESQIRASSRARARISEHRLGQNVVLVEDEFTGDAKTMKEHIELEWRSKKRDTSAGGGGLRAAASVFSQKLQKWRDKKKKKNRPGGTHNEKPDGGRLREVQIEARRSCDIEPRFSVDAGRISSVMDDPRFSFDEPRASWDGYMIARTIPRLAPMLSVIENAMNEQMISIMEDETNSNGSNQTRDYCSESSSSQRRNSFDCSSSGKSSSKNRVPLEKVDTKSFPYRKASSNVTKIVVTGPDAGHLDFDICNNNCLKSSESMLENVNSRKKTGKWGKVLKAFGLNSKFNDTRNGEIEGDEICREKQIGGISEASTVNLVRSNAYVNSPKVAGSYPRFSTGTDTRGSPRKSRGEAVFERNRSVRYSHSPNNFENGMLRFHLTPPLSSRKKKSERRSVVNSHSVSSNVV